MAAGLDPDHIQELFAAFGPVSVRRMFGGAGLFVDGLMIAIVSDGVIYLKAAPDGVAAFEAEGCGPFSYATKQGRRALASYWRMPERLYDDPDELAQWARTALAAAQAQASQPTKVRTGKKSLKKSPASAGTRRR